MRAALIALALVAAAPAGARAAQVIGDRQELDFDRPEAWALKYYGAAAQPTWLGGPLPVRPWSLRLGLEAAWIPYLDEHQRRVGFDGTVVEDLNKTPVAGRVRATVGLPLGFAFTATWLPPIRVNGLKPQSGSFALARHVLAEGPVVIGLHVWGQIGHATGDFTCNDVAVEGGRDPAKNPLGCVARSRDLATFRSVGGDAVAELRLGRLRPYATAGGSFLDGTFQVNALELGQVRDRTHLHASGGYFSATAGMLLAVTSRVDLVGEAYYAPLTVHRPDGSGGNIDGLFNVRGLLQLRAF